MTDGGWGAPAGAGNEGEPPPVPQTVQPPAPPPWQPQYPQPQHWQPQYSQPQYPQPEHWQPQHWQPPAPPRATAPEAREPRPYPQLLRGPDHRWWRPLVALLVFVGCVLALALAAVMAFLVYLIATEGFAHLESAARDLTDTQVAATPFYFLVNNLLLAALIPSVMAATWLVMRWRPRWIASVRPGVRWGWLLECAGWSTLFVGGAFALGYAADPTLSWAPQKDFWLFVVIVLLTQPLQAAGEEYAFRGFLTQVIGSWFSRAVVAALVSGIVTAALFALAHGGQSPWLFADRFTFGAVASYLVWRTGGLEAGIALHTMNNLLAIGLALVTGTLAETVTATDYPPGAAVADVVMLLLVAALITWRARRRGLQRVHEPALQPDRTVPAGYAPVPAGTWGPYQALAPQQGNPYATGPQQPPWPAPQPHPPRPAQPQPPQQQAQPPQPGEGGTGG